MTPELRWVLLFRLALLGAAAAAGASGLGCISLGLRSHGLLLSAAGVALLLLGFLAARAAAPTPHRVSNARHCVAAGALFLALLLGGSVSSLARTQARAELRSAYLLVYTETALAPSPSWLGGWAAAHCPRMR